MMNNQNGFSYVELLLSLCIFAIVSLSLIFMYIVSFQSNYSSRTFTQAIMWARDTSERLINMPYNHPDLDSASQHEEDRGIYTISWDVTDDAAVNNTKTIDISVSWNDNDMRRTISTNFIKSR
ncbi:MAG: type IV pilus modification PilV family protein [bacterium]